MAIRPLSKPQVLTDWSGMSLEWATSEQERLDKKQELQTVVEQFLEREALDDRVAKRARKNPSLTATPYAANRDMVLAIENALQTIGIDLNYFSPARRPQALHHGEARFFTQVEPIFDGDTGRRSAICHLDSQKTWIDIPRIMKEGKPHRPALHMDLDEGSKGIPMALFLALGAGIRYTYTADPWHRGHNDLKLSLVGTGAWICVCERLIVYNSPGAPWQGHGFWAQVQAAASEYFGSRDCGCELFQLVYKELLGPCGWTPPATQRRLCRSIVTFCLEPPIRLLRVIASPCKHGLGLCILRVPGCDLPHVCAGANVGLVRPCFMFHSRSVGELVAVSLTLLLQVVPIKANSLVIAPLPSVQRLSW